MINSFIIKIMNKGLIYLIQPEHLIGLNRFKIGFSASTDPTNITFRNSKKTRYLAIMECYDARSLVEEIKEILADKFTVCGKSDYFEGDEDEMVKAFTESVNDFIHSSDGDCDCDGECTGECDGSANSANSEEPSVTELVCNNCTVEIIECFEEELESMREEISHIKNTLNKTNEFVQIILNEIKELNNQLKINKPVKPNENKIKINGKEYLVEKDNVFTVKLDGTKGVIYGKYINGQVLKYESPDK